jgi:hypothetical protein
MATRAVPRPGGGAEFGAAYLWAPSVQGSRDSAAGSWSFMRWIVVVASFVAVAGWAAGCGGSGGGSRAPAAVKPPPVAPCSLLTAREVSRVLDIPVRVRHARFFCTYEGTKDHVFRAVVVTPQRVTAVADPTRFDPRHGPTAQIAGHGYSGHALDDPPSITAAGLHQSNAAVVSGKILVRLLVTYHTYKLRGVSQLHEVATLADRVGRQLAQRQ